jgi:hypothetical protein
MSNVKEKDIKTFGKGTMLISKILGGILVIFAAFILFSKVFFASYATEIGLTPISAHDSLSTRIGNIEYKINEYDLDSDVMSRNAVITNARTAFFRDSIITRQEYDDYMNSLNYRNKPAREILQNLNNKYLSYGRK